MTRSMIGRALGVARLILGVGVGKFALWLEFSAIDAIAIAVCVTILVGWITSDFEP